MVKWNGPFRSDRSNREKRSTSKGGPLFSKLFRLDLTDPFTFRPKFPEILVEWIAPREPHDFQPFCEPAFLAPHHGWITGLPIVFLDQSQGGLLKSSRLPCDWSILSLVYPTWRRRSLWSCGVLFVCWSASISRNLEKHNRKSSSVC